MVPIHSLSHRVDQRKHGSVAERYSCTVHDVLMMAEEANAHVTFT